MEKLIVCLILIAWNTHPRYRVIIAANRDEWRARPTAALGEWQTDPVIIAGQDLQAGGSWLGLSSQGRIAAVTNLRGSTTGSENPRSRGQLVTDFLHQEVAAEEYIARTCAQRMEYNGFNLLVGDLAGLLRYCSADTRYQRLSDGIHCICNGLPSDAWPKAKRSLRLLSVAIKDHQLNPRSLLNLLHDSWQPPDERLPQTGISLELERQLAPIFVTGKEYGTRCSSLIMIEHSGNWLFLERSYDTYNPIDCEFRGQIEA